MDRQLIVLILIIVVLVLLAGVIFTFNGPDKTDSKLTILSKDTLNEGDDFKIKIEGADGKKLSDEKITVIITDESGEWESRLIITDENGKGELTLDKPGKYSMNCTFEGNDAYNGNNTTQNLEVKEVVKEEEPTVSYESYSSTSSSDDYYGPEVDSGGVTREEAKKYGWTYTSEHGGHYIGSLDHWDEKAGMYHD